MSKKMWRVLWLLAVMLGGISLVTAALEILNYSSRKYIDV